MFNWSSMCFLLTCVCIWFFNCGYITLSCTWLFRWSLFLLGFTVVYFSDDSLFGLALDVSDEARIMFYSVLHVVLQMKQEVFRTAFCMRLGRWSSKCFILGLAFDLLDEAQCIFYSVLHLVFKMKPDVFATWFCQFISNLNCFCLFYFDVLD